MHLRADRRLRRKRLDGRGRRLLLEAEQAGKVNGADGQICQRTEGTAFLPALRPVAVLEDHRLDESAIHRAVPAMETGLDRVVLRTRAVVRRFLALLCMTGVVAATVPDYRRLT